MVIGRVDVDFLILKRGPLVLSSFVQLLRPVWPSKAAFSHRVAGPNEFLHQAKAKAVGWGQVVRRVEGKTRLKRSFSRLFQAFLHVVSVLDPGIPRVLHARQ